MGLALIVQILSTLVNLYSTILFVYVLMSWIPFNNSTIRSIYEFLGKICNPYLDLFRRFIPPAGNVDFSPIVAIIALEVAMRIIVRILYLFL